jgi:predicted AAA+ superfamily ATPase
MGQGLIKATPMALYKRSVIDEISHFHGTGDIVAIHGARQEGKSSILMYLLDQLLSYPEKVRGSSPLAPNSVLKD